VHLARYSATIILETERRQVATVGWVYRSIESLPHSLVEPRVGSRVAVTQTMFDRQHALLSSTDADAVADAAEQTVAPPIVSAGAQTGLIVGMLLVGALVLIVAVCVVYNWLSVYAQPAPRSPRSADLRAASVANTTARPPAFQGLRAIAPSTDPHQQQQQPPSQQQPSPQQPPIIATRPQARQSGAQRSAVSPSRSGGAPGVAHQVLPAPPLTTPPQRRLGGFLAGLSNTQHRPR
jgi:hypothetical protein